jgi:hypothetical protein
VIAQFVLLGLIFWLPVFPAFAFPASSIGTILKYLGLALLILAGLNLGRNLSISRLHSSVLPKTAGLQNSA